MAVTLDLDDIQGIIARGYSGLRHARFTVFGVDDPAAGPALLSWLLPQVTTAGKFSSDSAAHVAFTAAGLAKARPAGRGGRRVLAGVPRRDGRPEPEPVPGRRGDSGPDSWAWGAPGGPAVDGLVLLYARSADLLNERHAELMRLARRGRCTRRHRPGHPRTPDREPFGFRDGISQPVVEGLPQGRPRPAVGRPLRVPSWATRTATGS